MQKLTRPGYLIVIVIVIVIVIIIIIIVLYNIIHVIFSGKNEFTVARVPPQQQAPAAVYCENNNVFSGANKFCARGSMAATAPRRAAAEKNK